MDTSSLTTKTVAKTEPIFAVENLNFYYGDKARAQVHQSGDCRKEVDGVYRPLGLWQDNTPSLSESHERFGAGTLASRENIKLDGKNIYDPTT